MRKNTNRKRLQPEYSFFPTPVTHPNAHTCTPSDGVNCPSCGILKPEQTKRQERGSCVPQHMLTTCMSDWLTSLCKWGQAYYFSSSQPVRSSKKIRLQPWQPSMLVSLNEAYSVCQQGTRKVLDVYVCLCVSVCEFTSCMPLCTVGQSVCLSAEKLSAVLAQVYIQLYTKLKAVRWSHRVFTHRAEPGCVLSMLCLTKLHGWVARWHYWASRLVLPCLGERIRLKQATVDLFYFPTLSTWKISVNTRDQKGQ